MKVRTSGRANGGCEAVQYSDQMQCARCGVVYDVNDPDPPECLPQGVSPSFMSKLEKLIDLYSHEKWSNTPSYAFAHYLKSCLENFEMDYYAATIAKRDALKVLKRGKNSKKSKVARGSPLVRKE